MGHCVGFLLSSRTLGTPVVSRSLSSFIGEGGGRPQKGGPTQACTSCPPGSLVRHPHAFRLHTQKADLIF